MATVIAKQTILLLDDNPLVGRIWASQLAVDGFKVEVSHEISDAIERLKCETPAVVLVDSALPDMDGVTFCERLSALRENEGSPLVVLLTNINSPAIRERVEKGAAACVWFKHELNPREFCERLHELLGTPMPESSLQDRLNLGDALVFAGFISSKDLERANDLRKREKLDLDEALYRLKIMPPEEIRLLRELIYKADYVDLKVYKVEEDALARIPKDLALRYNTIPLRFIDGELEVVMADPRDVEAIDHMSRVTKCRIRAHFAPLQEVQSALLLHYGAHGLRHELDKVDPRHCEDTLMNDRTVSQLLTDNPVVEMLDVALMRAREMRASDIHIEPFEDAVHVRLRIDGMLQEMYTLDAEHARALASRVKILANLKLDETRLPQDGHFQTTFGEEPIDYRVSTMPVADGEKVVIRVLDRANAVHQLSELGFSEAELAIYLKLVQRPHGMCLITGPTGSGKSTTLFATLSLLRNPQLNIVSIEDPIEMRLQGVNQVQVNPRIGLTFATVLRNVLRQDPNIVMVGEVRDLETAELAVQASLTGHLVLGTLHTNDAPTGLVRLLDMGIPPYMITSTVNGLVAQRLMRKICGGCKEERKVGEGFTRELPEALRGVPLYKGKGCSNCRGTGYFGRNAIYELLPVNKKLKGLVLERRSAEELAQQAQTDGMRTLRDAAIARVKSGQSTIEEMWRVTLDAED
jgi:type IV pilus assembly protein PilB